MKIKLTEFKKHGEPWWMADMLDLPGSPPVGKAVTKHKAVAILFQDILFNKNTWLRYVDCSELHLEGGDSGGGKKQEVATLGLDESFEEMKQNLRHLDFCVFLHSAVKDKPPHSLAADITRRAGGQIGESLQYSEADKCWWFVINHPQIHDSVLKMWPEILDVKRAS